MTLRYSLPAALLLGLVLALSGCLSPIPGPGPGPKPGPAPIEVEKLVVLVIEETGERGKITRGQLNVLSSTAMRDAIKQAGGEYRQLDKDADVSRAEQWVKDGLVAKRDGLPWLIVASKKGGVSLPLPDSTEAVLKHVERFK